MHAGTVFMGGSHPAANGGAWMTAVFGFGGLRAGAEHVSLEPRLYPQWTRLEFPLAYKGDRFRIRITRDTVEITGDATNQRRHPFVVSGERTECAPGEQVCVSVASGVGHRTG
jgi:kojibiose phosphorylase